MSSRSIAALTACIALAIASPAAQRPRQLSVEEALAAAGAYLEQYAARLPGFVAEEDYVQIVNGGGTRRLRSDMLVVLDPQSGWIGFRDVFEVDGRPVRDRDERLQKLFLEPHDDRLSQALRIAEEGSRFNLNPVRGGVRRTINQPFLALKFLGTANQPRSEFRLDGTRTSDGAPEVQLAFTEKAKPRLIASPDDAAAEGWFWIDAGTGRVTASELRIRTGAAQARIRVMFGLNPAMKTWLPVRMDENYVAEQVYIEGHARYSKVRQFKVETETTVK